MMCFSEDNVGARRLIYLGSRMELHFRTRYHVGFVESRLPPWSGCGLGRPCGNVLPARVLAKMDLNRLFFHHGAR